MASLEELERLRRMRLRVITLLLEHYRDYFEISAGGHGSGEGMVAQLPAMAHHPSVIELCRCLDLLADESPTRHAHVKAFYTAEWRLARTRKRSQLARVERERCVYDGRAREFVFRQRLCPPWVDQDEVHAGVDYVEACFALDPELPRELYAGASL